MKVLLYNPREMALIASNKKKFKRGKEMSDAEIVANKSVVIEDGIIKEIIDSKEVDFNSYDKVINCENKLLAPAFVESHTHLAFLGSRANEFKMKIEGATYEQIAEAGGGIISTVKKVRQSSIRELIESMERKILRMIANGVGTIEIKSGYGLDYENEEKLLRAIDYFKKNSPIDIKSTLLAAHTFPPEYKNDKEKYVKLIKEKMLPDFVAKNLIDFCDGFCEKTAFSPEQIDSIFESAQQLGINLKLHTEQFNQIGGLKIAINRKATSVDHLEVIKESDIEFAASSDTVLNILPGVSFYLNYDYAPARKLIEAGGIVSLATDYNPGSSPIIDINFIGSLACLKLKMKVEEVLVALTLNAAAALDMSDKIGSIEVGKQADFAVFEAESFADLFYNVGINQNIMTIKKGKIIYQKYKDII